MLKFIILNFFCFSAFPGVLVKEVLSQNRSLTREISYTQKIVSEALVVRDLPMFMGEKDFTSKEIYRETIYPDYTPDLFSINDETSPAVLEGSEVRTIINQGPDNNRIVLTILGDGYTDAEKEKFFEDAKFVVDDLFVGITFKSYLPLFNIYAVFTPSKESGITDVVKKKTAFGLYRTPAGSKRAIMPGNTSAIEAALRLAPTANYPIILANDDFYGGLGGRYAISTRSKVSGPIVLRHELGHNFSNVGEEYDDGQVYMGANFSRSGVGQWDQWRETPGQEKHEAKYVFGAYVWQPLNKPFTQTFKTDDGTALFSLKISSVGWESPDDVEIILDGSQLKLTGVFTKDRSFFETEPFAILSGQHQLTIRSNGNNPNHVLAFADGFGYPEGYDFHSGEVKAFNVFDESRRQQGYRPTENTCLMRDMLSKVFCVVDQENIWLQFFKRITLIDSLKKTADHMVELKTIPLASSNLDISWFLNGNELTAFKGKTVVPQQAGVLKARVKLVTPEVRLKNNHFQAEQEI